MNARTVISAKGQVVIPKDVRDELGLHSGQSLDVSRVGGGVLLCPIFEKSGRSFDDITAHLHTIIRYEGPPVSVEDMNAAIAQCWEDAALRSDRARD